MMAAAVAGASFGLGLWIVVAGFWRRQVPLEALGRLVERPRGDGRTGINGERAPDLGLIRDGGVPRRLPGAGRVAHALHDVVDNRGSFVSRSMAGAPEDRAVSGIPAIELAVMCVYGAAAGLLLPVSLWALVTAVETFAVGVQVAGVDVAAVLLIGAACGSIGAYAPVVWHRRRASELRREFRVSLSTFVDLVVLALAGGMGVEGALVVAAESGGDWATQRIRYALAAARAGGVAPWIALDQLGAEIAVGELRELAAALHLAGTEGSKVRNSLAARAESMRRHQLADAEMDANAATERMFVPGALLLIGFLLFIGYPAFARIVTGI